MKYIFFILFFATTFYHANAQSIPERLSTIPQKNEVGALCMPQDIAPVKAPFPMPRFTKPIFPSLTMSITRMGAKKSRITTKEIQATIDQVNKKGGGTVLIPKGVWKTGRISLKSNVNLHLQEGAELHFSSEVEDYRPAVFTRNEGIEVMSLGACIYANGQTNIAVTGKGKLVGPGQGSVRKQVMEGDVIENVVPLDKPVSERVYEGYNGEFIFLPMFISPINCKNVYIEGITLENTAFWNIAPVYCDGVVIRGITVHSVGIPRGDGIDVESSRNVLIEYCTLASGDDCFTIKAGRGIDGLRVNKPTENVVIRYCLAQKGHGGITCGSETAGMIRNLYIHDCVFDETGVGIRFKTRRNRGGGGENLYYERLRMNLEFTAFNWDMLGSAVHMGDLASRFPPRAVDALTPAFRNIFMKDIIVERASQFIKINGIPESPLVNWTLDNAEVSADKLITINDAKNILIKNVSVKSKDSEMRIDSSKGIVFEKVEIEVETKK
ncbi:glycoside hydrolase family 28 protein [Arcticibacter eurypsychrophilus]|uniref:glycoside hydrolase family 28 protein n=1 Tax=Arcticibacter eurypsychrophilus TaxID=1434752 RepID=UPI00084D31B8|nr:glycoside hydrolase family 28 protein [Arcticibacter eurypsychrophilus]